jgi:hypothetical protein
MPEMSANERDSIYNEAALMRSLVTLGRGVYRTQAQADSPSLYASSSRDLDNRVASSGQ